jgi:hypothetical protein
MITINQTKDIRKALDLSQIIILGISKDRTMHVSTHGETKADAREVAEMGNKLKTLLEWPKNLCNDKPLERICKHCSFFQYNYHVPGSRIESNAEGKCMFNPEPTRRKEEDRACNNMEPIC